MAPNETSEYGDAAYEQQTGFRKIPGDIWHERCLSCGDVIDIGWVHRHRRTHEAMDRLVADLKAKRNG